jgi:hypothetical protein
MTSTIQFNTRRKYTTEGQVISATLHDDGVVTFMDHSRSIDGQYNSIFPEEFGSAEVLHMYDTGAYTSSKRSRDDGMMRGGCNLRKEV